MTTNDRLSRFTARAGMALAIGALLSVGACGEDENIPEQPDAAPQPDATPVNLDEDLAALIAAEGLAALPEKPVVDAEQATLGQALFFDKEISGNRDISCATCHHPFFGTGDDISLSIGTGGDGLGPERVLGADRTWIPRNAPEVFNRGYDEWTRMFWDGRVSGTPGNFTTPAGADLPASVGSLLAAQAMFPPTARDEMRGAVGDTDVNGDPNELAAIDDAGVTDIWSGIMTRLLAIPEYQTMFAAAFPGVDPGDLDFGHAATAIAAFEIDAYTFTDSPWDRYLRGDTTAINESAKRGALLFYGDAGCSGCHSGVLFTDQEFHVLAVPQVGPGKTDGDDLGRFGVTGEEADRYAFRTPPLRNVTRTGPWFHDGAYTTLNGTLRHHLDAAAGAEAYAVLQLAPELRDLYNDDPDLIAARVAALDPAVATPIELNDMQFNDVLAFLFTLTDPATGDMSATIPATVPSGLPVDGVAQTAQ